MIVAVLFMAMNVDDNDDNNNHAHAIFRVIKVQ